MLPLLQANRNRITIMKFHLFPFIAALIAVGPVSGNSKVIQSKASYSCCETPTLEFNQSCENTWTNNEKPFAHSKGAVNICERPCKKIEDGLLQLDACVNVKTSVVCSSTMGMIEEKHIHYYGQLCSRAISNRMAPGNQGSVGLVLLAVAISGWFVKQMSG